MPRHPNDPPYDDDEDPSVAAWTTSGPVRGGCGHTHLTYAAAEACAARDNAAVKRGHGPSAYSDRAPRPLSSSTLLARRAVPWRAFDADTIRAAAEGARAAGDEILYRRAAAAMQRRR